jgi:lysozyme
MKTNEAGVALIKKWESFRAKPYICPAGIPTIGYGTTMYPNGKKVTMQDKPITEQVADMYLRQHLERIELQTSVALQVQLSDNRFSALVSFVYNLGIGAFRKSTLLKVVNAAPGSPGIRVEFMKWTKATVNGKKVELAGLVSRRKSEADLYFNI